MTHRSRTFTAIAGGKAATPTNPEAAGATAVDGANALASSPAPGDLASLPPLLRAEDVAALLRTTRKAIYASAERRRLPGMVRLGRRLLFQRDELLRWLRECRVPSL